MKKIIKFFPIMLLSLFFISCSTPQINLRLASGRPLANPNYFLQDIGDTELKVTFWFTGFTTIVDKDKTVVYIPHTLNMENDNFLKKNFVKVIATIEVYNPKEIDYTITYDFRSKMKGRDGIDQQSGVAAISSLNYRSHTLELPLSENLLSSTFSGGIYSGSNIVFMLGPLNYKRGGDDY